MSELARTSPFRRFAPGSPEHAAWCANLSAAQRAKLVPCVWGCGTMTKQGVCKRHAEQIHRRYARAVRRVEA